MEIHPGDNLSDTLLAHVYVYICILDVPLLLICDAIRWARQRVKAKGNWAVYFIKIPLKKTAFRRQSHVNVASISSSHLTEFIWTLKNNGICYFGRARSASMENFTSHSPRTAMHLHMVMMKSLLLLLLLLLPPLLLLLLLPAGLLIYIYIYTYIL